MPRGGKRPGAGAPRGNLNAVKHGRFSPRVLLMLFALVKLPLFRQLLLRQLARDQNALKRREYNRQLEALAKFILSQSKDIIAAQVIRSARLRPVLSLSKDNANNQIEPPRQIQNG